MRIRPEQLADQSPQTGIYLLFGDEPLLIEESADLIRQQSREHGVVERDVWHVDGRFKWADIPVETQTMSLFSEKRLLEIRMPGGAPGREGADWFKRFCEAMPDDVVLLIISGKITPQQQKAKWFKTLEQSGVCVQHWPVSADRLAAWLVQRAARQSVRLSPTAAAMIAERVQGNLFAAAQEINKLVLLSPDGEADEQLVQASVADSARFEAFGLMDVIYAGEARKIPRMLSQLRAEGHDILSIFSAIVWSLQRCADMAGQLQRGQQLEAVFAGQKPPVWDRNKPLMAQVLKRHNPARWHQFLQQLAAVDRAAKGGGHENPWLLLENLCLQVAGTTVFKRAS